MRALVVGEAVLDVVHGSDGRLAEHPGGSAVNVAVALARLGRPVDLATAYAADPEGDRIAGHLSGSRVQLAGDPHLLAATSRAEAVVDGSGGASYSFEVAWELPDLDVETPHVLHLTSLAPVLEPGAAAVADLLARLGPTTTVSYDVNLRPAITGVGAEVVARIERTASVADLVKASDEDLRELWPDRTVGEAASHLLALGAGAVVVTHGEEGASWHAGSGATWSTGGVHGVPVEVVDTIGAGDTFAAALVDHLWPLLGAGARERIIALTAAEWVAALTYAARAASVTVGRAGADPPTRADLS